MKTFLHRLKKVPLLLSAFMFVTFPASTNYQLKWFEFGAGGAVGNSSNYSTEGIVGQLNGQQGSTNYNANSGLLAIQMANTPAAPAFVNTDNWYNRLKITVNTSNNAADATFAIAISTDNFVSDIKYVQNDNTLGIALGLEDFQTYSAWGGASGTFIIGLESSTTYTVKVKARQGIYTEGPFGPTAQATTADPSLSFDIDIDPNDVQTSPPYAVAFGDLTAGAVTTASDKVWVDFETNADSGGDVYIKGTNGALYSSHANFSIPSVSNNLASLSLGYGIQGNSASQTSGGPLSILSPYNGSSENVGIVDTTIRPIFRSTAPIVTGRGSFLLKSKINSSTPAADDYTELFTMIASATF